MRREITGGQLYERYPVQAGRAEVEALKAEPGSRRFPLGPVRERIEKSLGGRKVWALIGGPPCQAYSLVGRARMSAARLIDPVKYEKDKRHLLYREYLRTIAAHRPPVFVLENVKGILSSRIGGGKIIDRILCDLRHPGSALNDPTISSGLAYQLHSVVIHWAN